MVKSLVRMLRGLWMLRSAAIRRHLVEVNTRAHRIEMLRDRNPGVKLKSGVEVIGNDLSRITLGPGCSIEHGTILALADDASGGRITVGAGTWIGQYNNLRAGGGGDVTIGDKCLISQFCTLVGSNHDIARDRLIMEQGDSTAKLGVILDEDVWLGAGVVVLPGVHIGRGAVIGANAVITRDVAPYEIWTGVPGRRIGERR